MRKSRFSYVALCACVFAVAFQSCRKDSHPVTATVKDQSFTEEFDTLSVALSRGWLRVNASAPVGTGTWLQGGGSIPLFPAYSNKGVNAGYVAADYTSTSAAQGVISNWLISPSIIMQNGDKISFYTRTFVDPSGGTDYANRLQLRVNTTNDSTKFGTDGYDVGNFTTILLDINPNYVEHLNDPTLYSPYSYPDAWTRFEATVSGLNQPTRGRFAFRYFVEGGGFNGAGTLVAIDKVQYASATH